MAFSAKHIQHSRSYSFAVGVGVSFAKFKGVYSCPAASDVTFHWDDILAQGQTPLPIPHPNWGCPIWLTFASHVGCIAMMQYQSVCRALTPVLTHWVRVQYLKHYATSCERSFALLKDKACGPVWAVFDDCIIPIRFKLINQVKLKTFNRWFT